jgi:hypothetical protein
LQQHHQQIHIQPGHNRTYRERITLANIGQILQAGESYKVIASRPIGQIGCAAIAPLGWFQPNRLPTLRVSSAKVPLDPAYSSLTHRTFEQMHEARSPSTPHRDRLTHPRPA